jgi:hypothetical protein
MCISNADPLSKHLSFLNSHILYPEFEKEMTLYNVEADLLNSYMAKIYGISYTKDIKGLLNIPLSERWLKGEEYAFLLRHYKTYNKIGGF